MAGPDLRSILRLFVWQLRPGEKALAERLAEEHGLPLGPVEELVAELRHMPHVTVVPAPEEFAVPAGATSAKDARRALEAIGGMLRELDRLPARVRATADGYVGAIHDDTARTMLGAVEHQLGRFREYERALQSVADGIEAQGALLAELRESFERVRNVRARPGPGKLHPWLSAAVDECKDFWREHKGEPTAHTYVPSDGETRLSPFARFVHGIVRGVEGVPGLFPWITSGQCDEVLGVRRPK